MTDNPYSAYNPAPINVNATNTIASQPVTYTFVQGAGNITFGHAAYTISKSFTFSASHQLTHLPPDHKCAHLHGHNYTVRVFLRGHLDKRGFVTDYNDLDFFKTYLDTTFDHKHLNDVFNGNPVRTTAENLAFHFYTIVGTTLSQVFAIEVCETDKTCARYEFAPVNY